MRGSGLLLVERVRRLGILSLRTVNKGFLDLLSGGPTLGLDGCSDGIILWSSSSRHTLHMSKPRSASTSNGSPRVKGGAPSPHPRCK